MLHTYLFILLDMRYCYLIVLLDVSASARNDVTDSQSFQEKYGIVSLSGFSSRLQQWAEKHEDMISVPGLWHETELDWLPKLYFVF